MNCCLFGAVWLGIASHLLLGAVLAQEPTMPAPAAKVPGQQAPAGEDVLGVRLVTHPACAADIHRLCSEDNSITLNDKTPNIDVFSCLLDREVG